MSEQTQEQPSSREERFFGVKHNPLEKKDESEAKDSVAVEVVDERDPKDRQYGKPNVDTAPPGTKPEDDDDDNDDELESYSEKVQKRIKKLTYKHNEERRKREDAERLREEAIRVAKTYQQQATQQQEIIRSGEQILLQNIQQRAQVMLDTAKAEYRQAYEEGNTDKILEAQEKLSGAQAELRAVQQEIQSRQWQQQQPRQNVQQQAQPQTRQQQPQQRKPSDRSLQWAKENPWFQNPQHAEMTALAYGIHQKILTSGEVQPESEEYFRKIDEGMRQRFPEYFGVERNGSGEEPSSTHRSHNVVVAPQQRSHTATPRKVTLTRTQVALAKRLGLTPEQYAEQLLKEAKNG